MSRASCGSVTAYCSPTTRRNSTSRREQRTLPASARCARSRLPSCPVISFVLIASHPVRERTPRTGPTDFTVPLAVPSPALGFAAPDLAPEPPRPPAPARSLLPARPSIADHSYVAQRRAGGQRRRAQRGERGGPVREAGDRALSPATAAVCCRPPASQRTVDACQPARRRPRTRHRSHSHEPQVSRGPESRPGYPRRSLRSITNGAGSRTARGVPCTSRDAPARASRSPTAGQAVRPTVDAVRQYEGRLVAP